MSVNVDRNCEVRVAKETKISQITKLQALSRSKQKINKPNPKLGSTSIPGRAETV